MAMLRRPFIAALALSSGLWIASGAITSAEQPFGDRASAAAGAGLMSSPQREFRTDAARDAAPAGQPKDTLFGTGEERPGIRIGWHFDAAVDGLMAAIDRKVPFVLVLSEEWCEYCVWLVDALTCPSVNLFAGGAVFAISAPSRDKGAEGIASSLKIDAYPTITVLLPEARMLIEVGRINGYAVGDTLAVHLETIQRGYAEEASRRWQMELGETALRSQWELLGASKAVAVAVPLSKTPEHPSRCTK